jgi:hypothetical protein
MIREKPMLRARIKIFAFSLGLAGGLAAAPAGADDRNPPPGGGDATTLLVPAYFYPSGPRRADWDRLVEAARSVPLEVILNPASGPGERRDPNYVAVLEPLRRAGARILAYVDTDYGRRPPAAIEKDLRTYPRFYEIDGYFLDQMSNRPEDLAYYRSIREAVRKLDPRLRLVANPGTSTRSDYLETADTLVTFEGSARDFAGHDPRAAMPWSVAQPARRFAAIVYDVPGRADALAAISRAVRSGAGSVYITDQGMPNPYLSLPPYWAEQVAAVRARNESRPPSKKR